MTGSSLIVLIFAGVFVAMLISFSLGWALVEARRKKKVKEMLDVVSGKIDRVETSILLSPEEPRKSLLQYLLERLNLAEKLRAELQQADLDWSIQQLAIYSLAAALVGALLGFRFKVAMALLPSAAVLAVGFGSLPYLYVRRKRAGRLSQFEAQFPDALDFLARAMRAGHAFSVSLELLAEESPEPLAKEFRKVYNEQNLGAPLEVALANLAKRVPLLDVGFFVSAVTLQKETGGNLSEILNKLSYVIRERFKLKGQVKAASAHGRITALILGIMPVLTAMALMAVAPGYLQSLAEDPLGKQLIIAAILAQFLGFFIMKRIINIKV